MKWWINLPQKQHNNVQNLLPSGSRSCLLSHIFHRLLKTHNFQQPSVPTSGFDKCLRFGLWLTLCTIKDVIYSLIYLLYHLVNTVAIRRRRFVDHILRLPTTRPASLALEWIPEDGWRTVGRPRRTWQDTLKEDLDTFGCWLEWCERYCQWSCQMETTCRPMFCSEREELSLSK